MLEHLTEQGVTDRLQLVLVDRGVTAASARKLGSDYDLELRRVGWDDKQPVFRPIRLAWRVEVAHGRGPAGRHSRSPPECRAGVRAECGRTGRGMPSRQGRARGGG